ncbi:chorismate-binding protein, partial [Patulibacter sp. S7RM1-6]
RRPCPRRRSRRHLHGRRVGGGREEPHGRVVHGAAPQVVRAASAQHLATPIRAQLGDAVGVLDLVARLHPTPAVGGFPEEAALPPIPAIEGMDRGWYAGPVGWIDAAGDGDFSVALRSALLEPRVAHCFAGVGVVADSDPASELRETEVKLQALLPLLSA